MELNPRKRTTPPCCLPTQAFVDAVEQFVRAGGSLLLGGHCWYWLYTPGRSADQYPVNTLLRRFGMPLSRNTVYTEETTVLDIINPRNIRVSIACTSDAGSLPVHTCAHVLRLRSTRARSQLGLPCFNCCPRLAGTLMACKLLHLFTPQQAKGLGLETLLCASVRLLPPRSFPPPLPRLPCGPHPLLLPPPPPCPSPIPVWTRPPSTRPGGS